MHRHMHGEVVVADNTHPEPDPVAGGPVIRTATDLSTALVDTFLANGDAGDDAANSDLVAELRQWQRGTGRRIGD